MEAHAGQARHGKHLDETYVLLRQAVPHAEGIAAPVPVIGGSTGVASVGQLPFGGHAPDVVGDGSATATNNGSPPVSVGPSGSIFADQGTVCSA